MDDRAVDWAEEVESLADKLLHFESGDLFGEINKGLFFYLGEIKLWHTRVMNSYSVEKGKAAIFKVLDFVRKILIPDKIRPFCQGQ
jgi:hypothetical protein